jgi:hypothetical protein
MTLCQSSFIEFTNCSVGGWSEVRFQRAYGGDKSCTREAVNPGSLGAAS